MKLKNELEITIKRMEKLDKKSVLKHIENVRISNDYKNFDVRISNDLLRVCTPTNTICQWYETYNCNDNHITTLALTACKKLGYL